MVFFMTSGNFKKLVLSKMRSMGMVAGTRVTIGAPTVVAAAAVQAAQYGHLKSGGGGGGGGGAAATTAASTNVGRVPPAANSAASAAAVVEANAVRKGLLVALATLLAIYALMGAKMLLKGGGAGHAQVAAPDWASGRENSGAVAMSGVSTTEERQALQTAESGARRGMTDDELRDELEDI